MIVLMGWQFAAAEFLGAPVMVAILVTLLRAFLTGEMVQQARERIEVLCPKPTPVLNYATRTVRSVCNRAAPRLSENAVGTSGQFHPGA